jgi:hypothetical protein
MYLSRPNDDPLEGGLRNQRFGDPVTAAEQIQRRCFLTKFLRD